MRLIQVIFISLLLITIIFGCGEDHARMVHPRIFISLAPDEAMAEVNDVVLTISGPDMEPQEFRLTVNGTQATGTIVIPEGKDRLFVVRAYSADDVEYEGELLVESLSETGDALNLHLEAAKLTMKIVPSEIKASVGDVFQMDVSLQRVKDLFGCSFVLEYDPAMLEPLETANGGFLGNDALFLSKSDPGLLSVGATRKAGTSGVKGSGTAATVKFRALKQGDADVKILRNEDFAMRKDDGTNIDGFDSIIIKNLKVSIKEK